MLVEEGVSESVVVGVGDADSVSLGAGVYSGCVVEEGVGESVVVGVSGVEVVSPRVGVYGG